MVSGTRRGRAIHDHHTAEIRVRQILDWGSAVYAAMHLWARVRTLSLLARSAPEESECYDVTRTVEAHYRGTGP